MILLHFKRKINIVFRCLIGISSTVIPVLFLPYIDRDRLNKTLNISRESSPVYGLPVRHILASLKLP